MAMKGSVITKLWDAMLQLLLSCFRHRNNTPGKKEDLAVTLPSSSSHNTDVHDLSKSATLNDKGHHQKAEHHMEEESSQWITVDNSLLVSNKDTRGKEAHLPKEKSQENGTDDPPTRHLENHFLPDLGNDRNAVQDRVDAEVVQLNNSVHCCLHTTASSHQKMETDKASEQIKESENPSFIQGSIIGIQSIQEHQEAKVVQQWIRSNGGHHLDMDVHVDIEETKSTKLEKQSMEQEVFPVEVKCDEVVQEAEVDLLDRRNLYDQGNGRGSACAQDTTLPSPSFPDYRSSSLGSKLPSDVSCLDICFFMHGMFHWIVRTLLINANLPYVTDDKANCFDRNYRKRHNTNSHIITGALASEIS